MGRAGGRVPRPAGSPSVGVVLDASAVLAVLGGEPGHEEVERRLGADAVIGAVNLSEVVAKLAERGMPEEEIREAVGALALGVVALDEEVAYRAGMLRLQTKTRGLSLGDRACVALAWSLGATALSMERDWEGLAGVEVIRRGGSGNP